MCQNFYTLFIIITFVCAFILIFQWQAWQKLIEKVMLLSDLMFLRRLLRQQKAQQRQHRRLWEWQWSWQEWPQRHVLAILNSAEKWASPETLEKQFQHPTHKQRAPFSHASEVCCFSGMNSLHDRRTSQTQISTVLQVSIMLDSFGEKFITMYHFCNKFLSVTIFR